MSDAADFDVEKYRGKHDTRHEWDMKKNFMLAHHDKFDESHLVCMANCYINVELFGNRYPLPIMQQLKLLGLDLPKDGAAAQTLQERNQE